MSSGSSSLSPKNHLSESQFKKKKQKRKKKTFAKAFPLSVPAGGDEIVVTSHPLCIGLAQVVDNVQLRYPIRTAAHSSSKNKIGVSLPPQNQRIEEERGWCVAESEIQ